MLKLAKLGAKLAIVGSAVYFTVENSIWDKSEYANTAINRVKESFPDTNELLKNLPDSGRIATKWNEGVETAFNKIGNSSECLENSKSKFYSLLSPSQANESNITK